MAFSLGQRSRERLKGVHADLVRVVEHAIGVSAVDFTVLEGLRSRERQAELVAAGASQTMDSRHITGHAVDLRALVCGEVRWDWPLYHRIAEAMRTASRATAVPVRWGGFWGLLADAADLEDAVADYTARRRAEGRKPFLDGPHFELPKAAYPA